MYLTGTFSYSCEISNSSNDDIVPFGWAAADHVVFAHQFKADPRRNVRDVTKRYSTEQEQVGSCKRWKYTPSNCEARQLRGGRGNTSGGSNANGAVGQANVRIRREKVSSPKICNCKIVWSFYKLCICRPVLRCPPAASDTSGIYSGTSTEPSLVNSRQTPPSVQRYDFGFIRYILSLILF